MNMPRSNRRRYKCFVLIVCLSWVCILLMHAKLEDQSRYNDMFRGRFKSLLLLKEGNESEDSDEIIKSRKSGEQKLSPKQHNKETDLSSHLDAVISNQLEGGLLVETEDKLDDRLQPEHHNEEKEGEQNDEREDVTKLDQKDKLKEPDLHMEDSSEDNHIEDNTKPKETVEEVPERYGQSLREEVQEKVVNEDKNKNQREKKEKQILPRKEKVAKKPDGPGEMGKPVEIRVLTEKEKKIQSEGWDKYQYDVFVSDKISLHRSLPDKRDQQCKEEGRYLADLPSTSIVITFYDEAWSVLLRTIYSILERTPEHLIEEILLIDDFSSLDFLKGQLDEHVSEIPKVRIIHNEKREGLMRSRIIGAKAAKSALLTYIDSHCEATEGWLEPLLDVVKRDRNYVAVPIIDIINDKTFAVGTTGCNGAVPGGFDWRLVFRWEPGILPASRNRCDNFKTPAMAGGLFTIDKAFFEKLGYYDEKLEVWGGENIELSLKLWMCGGGIKIVPCSHVAHVYRGVSPYVEESQKQFGSYILNNYARVARVWLDGHKPYYFQRVGRSPYEGGDVTNALQVKNNLHCKPFQWYLDNVYPQLYDIKAAPGTGSIMNLDGRKLCLDTMGEKSGPIKVFGCHHSGGNQYWTFTKHGHIRQDKLCISYITGQGVSLDTCSTTNARQKWKYKDGRFIHLAIGQCLTLEPKKRDLVMKKCSKQKSMKWKFQYVNEGTMREYQESLKQNY